MIRSFSSQASLTRVENGKVRPVLRSVRPSIRLRGEAVEAAFFGTVASAMGAISGWGARATGGDLRGTTSVISATPSPAPELGAEGAVSGAERF